jgi:hypothetical protein
LQNLCSNQKPSIQKHPIARGSLHAWKLLDFEPNASVGEKPTYGVRNGILGSDAFDDLDPWIADMMASGSCKQRDGGAARVLPGGNFCIEFGSSRTAS